ncbi:NAD-dependent succinate-semialdehyde dehydrogenase [Polycladomyces subterraneus]|uniref:NAD-dependent succinate-semialdehyde dehydrogenase n=1 Tax=Polycladomyces subterraneus TaxID=1016997 RepID=A0ABT8IJA6_9BACL|nr:NAD-dependent succinate-semialdehyde dehydrogenase [Polycladomyces subterraneus]MDN4592837.1 NAD-dependent succinate-semialdehyde dehydrogenase [Polycladomyces subterraneus]
MQTWIAIHQRMWIGGQWMDSETGETVTVFNPANGEVVGDVPKGGRKETAQAVDAAHQAFPDWSGLTAAERGGYLKKWAEEIRRNRESLAHLLTMEQGKPLSEALEEVDAAADFSEWYGEEAKRVAGEALPGSKRDQRILVIRQPVGVAALITPWNYPATMVTRKMAAALAAGCTMVLKPASQTPLTAAFLMQLLEKTGLPSGVANLVTGNAGEIGQALLDDPKVRKISFTGSTEVGKQLIEASARQVKRLSLELGGNAPLIVFSDADVDRAVAAAVGNKFENCGQMCNGINVIYVHERVLDDFLKKLVDRVRRLRVGFGWEPETEIGPVIDEAGIRKIDDLVRDAVEKGAEILTGGRRLLEGPLARGTFYAPTVLAGVSVDMRITQEEIFGPVAPVVSFSDEEEIVKRVNDTPYGLAAYFFTQDIRRAFTVAEGLEFGMVAVNGTSLSVPQAPFGGIKESGQGREGGRYGMEEFLNIKYLSINL